MTKRKTFINEDNPALRFITSSEEREATAQGEATPGKAPNGYKLNPAYIETKSKRVQLLMQPSLYSKIKDLADQAGISLNEYIHQTLENITKGE